MLTIFITILHLKSSWKKKFICFCCRSGQGVIKNLYSPGNHTENKGQVSFLFWLASPETRTFSFSLETIVELTVITLADCPSHSWTAHQKNSILGESHNIFLKFSLFLLFNLESFFFKRKEKTHPAVTAIHISMASKVLEATWLTFALEPVQKNIIYPLNNEKCV